jgi:uncharacterized membrane protein
MSNYKKMLILFILLISILALIFYLYKQEMADYIQVSLERSGSALEDKNLPQILNIDDDEALDTDSITQTRFRILKEQVPKTFLEDKAATSTSINNKSLFFRP